MSAKDGGPAFAHGGSGFSAHSQDGMSLRDFFAAHALAFLIHGPNVNWPVEQFADLAYQIADAMIAERAK